MKSLALALFLPLLLILSFSSDAQVPTDGLVAYFPFNGNAHDESGNGNDGAVHGAQLAQDRFGNQNSAYRFDGINDYILFGNNPSTLLLGDMSISVWIQMGTIPSWFGPVVARGEWGEGEDDNQPFNIHIMNVDGAPYLRHSHESGQG
ncbi:MAG: hypothetical protein OEV30_12075, partial [Ignavibacteria bacterium]|nr:hypothetical protein [Ignavibacteria bacterium]